ncbi:hypothetical protein FGO68_gene8314 [Halteria grandinella]|uniref:Uncharacterized protein n=1 Tax=Halteria grandinella TaxID=5974 RepID=A0A8J8NP81_HALGN|nr:hypothetical protein FGO68_gene8314 [Halteria grandinella]
MLFRMVVKLLRKVMEKILSYSLSKDPPETLNQPFCVNKIQITKRESAGLMDRSILPRMGQYTSFHNIIAIKNWRTQRYNTKERPLIQLYLQYLTCLIPNGGTFQFQSINSQRMQKRLLKTIFISVRIVGNRCFFVNSQKSNKFPLIKDMIQKIIPSIVHKETLQWRIQKFTLFKLGLWYMFQVLGTFFTIAIYYSLIIHYATDAASLQIQQKVLYYLCAVFVVFLQNGLLFTLILLCYRTNIAILQYLPIVIFLINGIVPLCFFVYTGINLHIQDPTWKNSETIEYLLHAIAYLALSSLICLCLIFVQVLNEERVRTEKQMPILSKRTLKSFFDEINEKKRIKQLQREETMRKERIKKRAMNHRSAGSLIKA